MATAAQLAAIAEPAAWKSLTPHQRMIVKLVTRPSSNGRRSITGIAQGLGVSRQAIYDTLELAGHKFEDFAEAA